MSDNILEVRSVSKAYEGVQALDQVSLSIKRGSVHCLVGENGSGKSTLIKIVGGVVARDSGEVVLDGQTFEKPSAIDAISAGVQIIYQDLSLFPNLSVAENISINQLIERGAKTFDWSEIRSVAKAALDEIEESLDLDARVETLSMAKKQVVAISRALTQSAKLIIMDEPTSAITREDVDHLFAVIDKLKKKGIATLFVSHKLNEVFEIAETVTVIRDGKKVGDYPAEELDNDKLVFLMTGRKIEYEPYIYEARQPDEKPVLTVEALTRPKEYSDVSFSIRSGEILGLTGLIGSGRTEVAQTIFGLTKPRSGRILVEGEEVTIRNPRDAQRLGIAYLPEDRLHQGLFQHQSIGDNVVVTILKRLLGKVGILDMEQKKAEENRWVKELAIKTPSAENPASSLSGGNQQRVVIAKWLATDPKVFILDGPTIGIDISSKQKIHDTIRELAKSGMAIIMISDEIDEVLKNCNRVLVMRKGKIISEITDTVNTPEDDVFDLVTGKKDEVA
ncbi:MAG: sugar ABC transporter ATP-binding protein [Spirochaetaceae bacterium]